MSKDTGSLLLVLALAAAAPLIAAGIGRLRAGLVIPIAVAELILGIVFGPEGLKLTHMDPSLTLLSTLGLGFLFFFAGYEIEFEKIKGPPLRLALRGWGISLALGYGIAALLYALGVIGSSLLVGSALVTTAIGTILPVLRDTDQLDGRFGPMMLAAGAVGELGPILIVTLVLTAGGEPLLQTILLVIFGVLTLCIAILTARGVARHQGFLARTLHTTGQVPVRITVLLLFALVVAAARLGLDIILGAFAAGMVVRLVVGEREVAAYESKLEAIGFGVLIPFYFITSGIKLDLNALDGSVTDVLKVPLFLLLMLVVRGAPALLLYRKVLDTQERAGLALFSATQLPLVVAITGIGVAEHRLSAGTAAALVCAAALSVLLFPTAGVLSLNRGRARPVPSMVIDAA